jgi:epoxyqueuosine reductase
MAYLHRHAEARAHPSSILPNVRSVVMVGMNYHVEPGTVDPERLTGKVARYALGADYHEVLRQRLKRLLSWVQEQNPDCWGRAVVDTAPLLERDFARRAGLGWFGKNTMLINKKLGSYFFLGALLLDIELNPDAVHEAAHCGTCTACLDACPTEAFVGPGVLDARRCLSYLNIELRGPVPKELRPHVHEWAFGCDICQEVCPWNRKAPLGTEPAFAPREDFLALDLIEVLGLTEEAFRERFRGTALMRAKRTGLLRTAALILGNRGDSRALPALERASEDSDPAIREACEWAMARIRESMPV